MKIIPEIPEEVAVGKPGLRSVFSSQNAAVLHLDLQRTLWA